ncbi:hypothetical protein ON010_g14599 [Phytophthora cinnamomi]|nr:hypothetical protein ON010_g14599 [Phytophthora cinnamomi]
METREPHRAVSSSAASNALADSGHERHGGLARGGQRPRVQRGATIGLPNCAESHAERLVACRRSFGNDDGIGPAEDWDVSLICWSRAETVEAGEEPRVLLCDRDRESVSPHFQRDGDEQCVEQEAEQEERVGQQQHERPDVEHDGRCNANNERVTYTE